PLQSSVARGSGKREVRCRRSDLQRLGGLRLLLSARGRRGGERGDERDGERDWRASHTMLSFTGRGDGASGETTRSIRVASGGGGARGVRAVRSRRESRAAAGGPPGA